jgi:DNA repair exonuclease SbcCD ATPase subunit
VATAPAAQQKVDDANAALSKARIALNSVVDPLRKVFETTPEWMDASKAFKAAQSKYDAAKAAVLTKVQATPEYAAAAEAKHTAEDAKNAIVKDETATVDQKMAAASAVMDAAKVVTDMEVEALAGDADFQDAKQKLVDASAAVEKLNAAFEASIKDKPEFQQAKQVVDTAQQDVDKAKQDLAAAQQADAQAMAAYQQQLAAWQRAQANSRQGAPARR